MESELQMKSTSLPIKYLGVQLHRGKERAAHFANLISAVQAKLAMWQNKYLNCAGRLILMKHVLAAITLHILSACMLPQSVIRMLHRLMTKFFWGYNEDRLKHSWVSSEKIFRPTLEGGLGLRKIDDLRTVYSCRLWWRYQKNESLKSKFLHSRYANRNSYEIRITDSPVWKRICRIHTFCQGNLSVEQYTISRAYDRVRTGSNCRLSFKFIWHNHIAPNIRVFLWRLYQNVLPLPTNLQQFLYAHPSQCPVYLEAQVTVDHIFLVCSEVVEIWTTYKTYLDGPTNNVRTLQQQVMHWWMSTKGKTLKCTLRIVAPSFIVWEL